MDNINLSKNPVQVMRDLGIDKYPDVSKEYLDKLETYCDELLEDTPDALPNPYLDQYYLGATSQT